MTSCNFMPDFTYKFIALATCVRMHIQDQSYTSMAYQCVVHSERSYLVSATITLSTVVLFLGATGTCRNEERVETNLPCDVLYEGHSQSKTN